MMRKQGLTRSHTARGEAVLASLVALGLTMATAARAETLRVCGPVQPVPACAVKVVAPPPVCGPVKVAPPVFACQPVAPLPLPRACEPAQTYAPGPVHWTEGHLARLVHHVLHHHPGQYVLRTGAAGGFARSGCTARGSGALRAAPPAKS